MDGADGDVAKALTEACADSLKWIPPAPDRRSNRLSTERGGILNATGVALQVTFRGGSGDEAQGQWQ
jgi:hypothetical protein